MKAGKRKGFLMYHDNGPIIHRLPDDQAGKLIKALFEYSETGERPDFESVPALAMAFDMFSVAIDRDSENYKKRCDKNRENINKRWNKKNTSVYDGIQTNTNYTNNNNNNNNNINNNINNNNNNNINNNISADASIIPFDYIKKSDRKKLEREQLEREMQGFDEKTKNKLLDYWEEINSRDDMNQYKAWRIWREEKNKLLGETQDFAGS